MENRRGLIAAAVAMSLAAAVAVSRSAKSDDDVWGADAVRTRYPDPDAAVKPEGFAGTAECKDCHEDRFKSLATSFHADLRNEKKSNSRGCESCHGPGAGYVDDAGVSRMRNPNDVPDVVAVPAKPAPKDGAKDAATDAAKDVGRPPPMPVSVRAMNGVCLRCHADVLTAPKLGHREWLARTRYWSGERSCVSCHSVHVDKSRPAFDRTIGPFATAADLGKQAEFADPAQCVRCHTEFHPQMARSGHAPLLADGPEHGCGACHGPGSLHVASGGDAAKIILPTKQRPTDADASCNACHRSGSATQKWTCSEHSRQGVACIVCHDANARRGRTLRKPEFELCGQCHLDVQAQFRLGNRHRVAEGRMGCSDCHDPHGNTDKVRDMDLRLAACTRCHQEKAGPFLFDHGIKRGEGCVACHDPHGSVNRRMLTYPRIQPLCMQCHPEVSSSHDLKNRTYANCIDCHSEVHGSDLSRRFLK
jgi:DmsE family decaheme c-type cytochrome